MGIGKTLIAKWSTLREWARAVLTQNIFVGRTVVLSRNGGVRFIPIAKVANTSIRMAISTVADEPLAAGDEPFSFAYVRNPYDRLVSCYTDKYREGGGTDESGRPIWYFDNYLNGYMREDKGFDCFVKKVIRLPKHLMDRHFCPQHLYLYKRSGSCLVQHIGHYETLTEDFEALRQKYGFGELPHENASPRRRTWMDYYTKETAELVYRKFRKDFKLFGYEESHRELLEFLQKGKGGQGAFEKEKQ